MLHKYKFKVNVNIGNTFGLIYLFNGISTFMDDLMPKLSL